MKNILKIILLLLFFPMFVNALDTTRGVVKSTLGNGINLRSGAGTSYSRVGGLDDGRVVIIVDEVETTDDTTACSSWYKIVYSNGYAYACKKYINIVLIEQPSNYDFQEELAKFPIDYQEKIKSLHEKYPNAMFFAINASDSNGYINFQTALDAETNSLGKSLIWDSNNTRNGLKNLNSFDYTTATFSNNYSGGGKNWYAANREVIAYYLDPRNFLDEKAIFMFESLSYNSNYHTEKGVEGILVGSYMANAYTDNSEILFSTAILDAGIYSKINPYFLASRILQEVGYTRSALVKGTYELYPQFNGYYNYYNIGAGGNDVVYNGLYKAYSQGWNSEYKAIVYGSSWIGNNYINIGQDTQYFQKWDIKCSNKTTCFSNQYMQNIEAPYNESIKTYNAYIKGMGEAMYLIPFIFNIPIYQNMPESTSFPNEKSPINYLNSIIVDGTLINNFDLLTYEYDLSIPYDKDAITVSASALVNTSKVSGTGNIEIKDEKDITISVSAENGDVREYILHVKKQKLENMLTLQQTIDRINGLNEYLTGYTNFDVLKDKIVEINPSAIIKVTDINGNEVNSNLATGYTLKITVSDETREYKIVIYGDNNGDGEITILDLLRIQKHLLKSSLLTNENYESCDVNKDGEVTILDLLLVQKHLLGSKYINQ